MKMLSRAIYLLKSVENPSDEITGFLQQFEKPLTQQMSLGELIAALKNLPPTVYIHAINSGFCCKANHIELCLVCSKQAVESVKDSASWIEATMLNQLYEIRGGLIYIHANSLIRTEDGNPIYDIEVIDNKVKFITKNQY